MKTFLKILLGITMVIGFFIMMMVAISTLPYFMGGFDRETYVTSINSIPDFTLGLIFIAIFVSSIGIAVWLLSIVVTYEKYIPDPKYLSDTKQALRDGMLLVAIKTYREGSGKSLRESKDYVDEHLKEKYYKRK